MAESVNANVKSLHKHMKGMGKTNNKNDPLLSKRSTNSRKKEIQHSTSKIDTEAKAKKKSAKQTVLIINKPETSVTSNRTDERKKWSGLMRNSVFFDQPI